MAEAEQQGEAGTVEVKGAEWLPWEPAFPRRGVPFPHSYTSREGAKARFFSSRF